MLVALVTREHELVSINGYADDTVALTPKTHDTTVHVLQCRPVVYTRLASAVKPVLRPECRLSLGTWRLSEHGPVVLRYHLTIADAAHCSDYHFCPSLVPTKNCM